MPTRREISPIAIGTAALAASGRVNPSWLLVGGAVLGLALA
ncbi:MAG: hypothetical protein ACJ787_22850 [Myxococcales bacterium]